MKCMCGSCWPTLPYIFNPTLNIKMVFVGKKYLKWALCQILSLFSLLNVITKFSGPRSAVGNVSGNRCESDCRSRDREFNPGLVQCFPGDWSWNNFYGHSPPIRWIIQEGLLSVTRESVCTKYWLTAFSSLPRKKCGKMNWPSNHDHRCWLGT